MTVVGTYRMRAYKVKRCGRGLAHGSLSVDLCGGQLSRRSAAGACTAVQPSLIIFRFTRDKTRRYIQHRCTGRAPGTSAPELRRVVLRYYSKYITKTTGKGPRATRLTGKGWGGPLVFTSGSLLLSAVPLRYGFFRPSRAKRVCRGPAHAQLRLNFDLRHRG